MVKIVPCKLSLQNILSVSRKVTQRHGNKYIVIVSWNYQGALHIILRLHTNSQPSLTSILDWIKWFSSASNSSLLMAGKEVKSEISSKFEQCSSNSWMLFIVRIVECATLKTRMFRSEALIFCARTWSEMPVDVPHSKISKVGPTQCNGKKAFKKWNTT